MTGGPKRLYRSSDQRIVLGVCGGVAEYFNIDPTVVRIVLVIGSIFTGFVTGIIVYGVLAIIMPAETNVDMHPTDAARSTVNEAVTGAKQAAGTASGWVSMQVKRKTGGSSDANPANSGEDNRDQPVRIDIHVDTGENNDSPS